MKYITFVIIIFVLLTQAYAGGQDYSKAELGWWTSRYGIVPVNDPLATKAHEIFEKITRVAEHNERFIPRLTVIPKGEFLLDARALHGGDIIMSSPAIAVCLYGSKALYKKYYELDPLEDGEARLAFVLGHEVAHEVRYGFMAIDQKRFIEENLADHCEFRYPNISREKIDEVEQWADEGGMLYTFLAGYPIESAVGVLVDLDPNPGRRNARDEFIKTHLSKIISHVKLFYLGVLYYNLGDYYKSISDFDEYRKYYPGREVFHNLATAHHRLATCYDTVWPGDPLPWRLSFDLELATRADPKCQSRNRGTPPDPRFKENLEKAVDYYKRSIGIDPTYVKAYNSLGCALILKGVMEGNLFGALDILTQASRKSPDDPVIMSNIGVAYCIEGQWEIGLDLFNRAYQKSSQTPQPVYNLTKFAYMRKGHFTEDQKEHYANLARELDPDSPWSKLMRYRQGVLELSEKPQKSLSDETINGLTPGNINPNIFTNDEIQIRYRIGEFGLRPESGMILINNKLDCLFTNPDYKGKTALGIEIGDADKSVKLAYGSPYLKNPSINGCMWSYPKLGIAFLFGEDKNVKKWYLFHPLRY